MVFLNLLNCSLLFLCLHFYLLWLVLRRFGLHSRNIRLFFFLFYWMPTLLFLSTCPFFFHIKWLWIFVIPNSVLIKFGVIRFQVFWAIYKIKLLFHQFFCILYRISQQIILRKQMQWRGHLIEPYWPLLPSLILSPLRVFFTLLKIESPS